VNEIIAGVAQPLQRVEAVLRKVAGEAPESLAQLVEQSLFPKGKRLRPVVVLLAAKAVGRLNKLSVQVAAAVELVHTASLIHDDVVDDAPVRRGHEAAHKRFGTRLAVLGGDYLLGRALQLAGQIRNMAMLDEVADLMAQMSEAETAELVIRHANQSALEEYLKVIEGKTAALFKASAALGALSSGATQPELQALREYGQHFGLAFQIIDDVLDFEGEPATLGKPVSADLSAGRWTLPVLLAKEKAEGELAAELEGLLESEAPDSEAVERLNELVRALGGVTAARNVAIEEGRLAKQALEVLEKSKPRRQLERLADWVVQRSY